MSRAREFADLASSADAGGLTGRNIVINGACQVAQRSASVTGLGTSHDAYHTVDRFKLLTGSDATAGRFTMSQSSVTDLAGFSNAIKLQCTTADTSIAAGEACVLSTVFEGQDLQRLLNTSTSTKAFTVSFYAKANESRAVALEVRTSHGTNRQIAKLFTITSSWQRFEFNVPASASGMQFGNDNSNDLQLNWWQHAGSTYAGGTLSADWEGATNANRAAGVGSLFASTNNFFEITGIQLEVGDKATPFEHESFTSQWHKCQRYCTVYNIGGGNVHAENFILAHHSPPGKPGHVDVNNRGEWQLEWPVKRASPTLTFTDLSNMRWGVGNNGLCNGTSAGAMSVGTSPEGGTVFQNVASGITQGASNVSHIIMTWIKQSSGNNPKIVIDAEL